MSTPKQFLLEPLPVNPVRRIDYAKELNEEQLAVVQQGEGHCLVLAGAGSGKTRTIVYRVAWLLEQGVPAESVLLLTFTNKAAREMLNRVETLLGNSTAGLWGGTFHHIANRLLRRYATLLGYTPDFSILDSEDSRDLIALCVKELEIDTSQRRFPSAAVLQNLISFSANSQRPLNEVVEEQHPRFLPLLGQIEAVAKLYSERKQKANAMDFDDLLANLVCLLLEQESVRQRLNVQFRYILVDEYQDTNKLQAEIVKLLAGGQGNVLVVGDDAQSIYSFRAADIANIMEFPKVYPDTQVFRLETNYRSTPEILALANEVIQQNSEQYQKTLRAVRPSLERPNVVPAMNALQEADFIAQAVLRLRDQGVALSQVAVLFRATYHSQHLEMELTKRDIPYDYRGGLRFFERAHIKDALAYLRLLANQRDQLAWLRVLSMQEGIGPALAGKLAERLAKLASWPQGASEISAVDDLLTSRGRTGYGQFLEIWKTLIATEFQPAQLINAVADSNYQDYLEAQFPNFQERLADLKQLAVYAEQQPKLSEFLSEVSLQENYGAARGGADAEDEERLVLSTIHQAKGLEWHTVFVMHLLDAHFPNQRAVMSEGGLAEERRLFYVAVTRAQQQLYLTYPLTSAGDGFALQTPSQFIREIPEEFLERVELVHAHLPNPSSERRGPKTEFLAGKGGADSDELQYVSEDFDEEAVRKRRAKGSFLPEVEELG